MRRLFYFLLNVLLLRAWHIRRALRQASPGIRAGATILDAGCGFGQYAWQMHKMNRNWNIEGIDIDGERIGECEIFFTKAGLQDSVSFRVADLTTLNATGCYDVILSVDVMEHIEDDAKVFSNFYRALKKGGTVIISTPSDMGGSDAHGDSGSSFIDEHVRDGYSREDIREKLSAAGFSHVKAAYTYGACGHISWLLSMKYPIAMLNASRLFFIILPLWYLVFLPVSLVLNHIDVNSTHNSGTGLLVTAIK
jgi:SAM-dependent methyltransferase